MAAVLRRVVSQDPGPEEIDEMHNRERGQALVLTMAGVALVLFSVLVALTITQFSGRLVGRQLLYQGQALNVAQAGVSEGLSWFNRQTTQPVVTFAPVLDTTQTPPINETEEPAVGLVRSFQISGNMWGRYQMRATGSSPATNTIDVSLQRGKSRAGMIWQLESTGIVYMRNSSAAYNVSPNRVIASRTIRAEIQRLGFTAPTNAALLTSRGNAVNLPNQDVRIRGGLNTAIGWVDTPSGSKPTGVGYTSATNPPNDQVSGAPVISGTLPATPNRFSIPYVFGVTQQELLAMADYNYATVASLPNPLPDWKLIVLCDPTTPTQTFTFTQTRPLTGNGILIVLGNLLIAPNSESTWNGVIYVRGGYTQNEPSAINGTVIVDGSTTGTLRNVVLSGQGERAEIRYDPGLLAYLQRRMGLYTISRPAYIPCTSGPGCD